MKERLHGIDILRGIAIIMVFLFHCFEAAYNRDSLPWLGNWPDWQAFPDQSFHFLYFLRLGTSGVALFFVLSGFCIHYSSLSKEKNRLTQSTAEFYWHRFFRIYPPYFTALFVFLLFNPVAGRLNAFAHVSFTHNLFTNSDIFYGINPSFWSLPVEFQLYLIYPLFLIACRKSGARSALFMTFVLTMIFLFVVPSTDPLDLKRLPFYYWFYWAIGAYIAEIWFSTGRPAFRWHAGLIGVLAVLWIVVNYYRPLSAYYWMIGALLSAVVVDRILLFPPPKHSRLLKALSAIGLVSYSMYLWHQPLLPRIFTLCQTLLGINRTPAALYWTLHADCLRSDTYHIDLFLSMA